MNDYDDYDGQNRRAAQKWVVRKEITVGDITTAIFAMTAIATAYFTLDKRIALIERGQEQQMVIDRIQDTERITLKADLREGLTSIETKVDWLIRSRLDQKWTR